MASTYRPAALCFVLSAFGCAMDAPLKLREGASVPRSIGSAICMEEVGARADVKVSQQRLDGFRDQVRSEVGKGFASVTTGPCPNDRVSITFLVTSYEPGSAFLRGMLIGLGAARFDVEYNLVGPSREVFADGKVCKWWGWGGILGASKDIDHMVKEAAAEVAADVKAFREKAASHAD